MGMIYAPPSIIPNGALINDVCHIYQSIKPTARPDGSALQIGDRWYSPTRIEASWNGTYWLNTDTVTVASVSKSGNGVVYFREMFLRTGSPDQQFIITEIIIEYHQTVANYNFKLWLAPLTSFSNPISLFDENLSDANVRTVLIRKPNLVIGDTINSNIFGVITRLDGTSSTLNYNYNITYTKIL